jgi:gluconolactonase
VATGFRFTEGPLWDPATGSLLFSDIPAGRIYAWHQGEVKVFREESGKSNGLTWHADGGLLACEHLNRRVSRTLADGTVVALAEKFEGRRVNSPNDLVCHSSGAVYFSDPPYGIQSADQGALAEQEQPLNGLYLVRPGEHEPVLVGNDFERPNGMAFSPDERWLYVADTPRYHLRRFEVREDGTLGGGEVLATLDAERGQGRPDGLKVDTEGRIYTTGPGGLWVLSPEGEALGHVAFPEKTSNCAWGDEDWRSLYVTTGPSIYRLRTLVPGLPPAGAAKRAKAT